MKPLRNWLLPGLTCLLALSSALLPQQLSQMHDHRQFGRIHADEMTVDSGFPALDTALIDRLGLLSRAMLADTRVVTAVQELMPSAARQEPDALARAAFARLQDAGVLPDDLPEPDWIYVSGERVIYQDSVTGEGASFLHLSCPGDSAIEEGFWCTVDEQTGAVCSFTYISPLLEKTAAMPEETTAAFFRSLGLSVSILSPTPDGAGDTLLYQADGNPAIWYQFRADGARLLMELTSPAVYGYAVPDGDMAAGIDGEVYVNDRQTVSVIR